MEDSKKFEAFKRQAVAWHEETYGREARDRYGDREVDQAQAAVQALTQDQYLQWKQLGEEIQGKLEEAVRSGRSPPGGGRGGHYGPPPPLADLHGANLCGGQTPGPGGPVHPGPAVHCVL